MTRENVVTYSIIAACIIGIIFVSYLILTSPASSEYFSELYFEDHVNLPKALKVGEEESFAFTLVSHEKNRTVYTYKILFGGELVEQGSISLDPEEELTTKIKLSPKETTLRYITSDLTTQENHLIFDRKAEGKILILSPDGSIDEIDVGNSDITAVIGAEGVIWSNIVRLPVEDFPGNRYVESINLNLKKDESYSFSCTSKEIVDNSSLESDPFLSPKLLANLSSIGFNIINKTSTIENSRGDVTITCETNVSIYRYEKKKVEVQVITDTGKEYEIHFWTIVQ